MTKPTPPMRMLWDGEAFIPKVPALADRHYVVGETYSLVPHEDRSAASHNHYFASVTEAHNNLPEHLAERFPTPEHLRKFALIKAGYRDERSIVCASKAEALRVKAFVEPIDDYALVIADGALVTVFTAKSQKLRAMGKKAFAESKDAVLRVISEMIGTDAGTLQANTARAA
jgi:hypothetical protein